jgi:hypothetical protein
LSVKNLENFNKSSAAQKVRNPYVAAEYNPNVTMKPNYHVNYFLSQDVNRFPIYEQRWKMLQNIRNIAIQDDRNFPSLSINQEKDADQISTASSTTTTNFTGTFA